ncbi:hypothetical protein [Humisphaera borealis]|uniref:Uncharacterized protein n=1 Tax=Humisphaera borealis TaxID=2807512 RepID=A0A7M2X2A5_9BACT|nr:hypothetical protein [Humisphaera borealis]QOV91878.1 hypothetical protein IPV69_11205 [Humisphaera borealis]
MAALHYYIYRLDALTQSWHAVPSEHWRSIVAFLREDGISTFGLKNVVSLDDLRKAWPFRLWTGRVEGTIKYQPYHGVAKVDIARWEFNSEAELALTDTPLSLWSSHNEHFPTDEIVFFAQDDNRAIVVPYENMILFMNMSESDIERLGNFDCEILPHLYQKSVTGQLENVRQIGNRR